MAHDIHRASHIANMAQTHNRVNPELGANSEFRRPYDQLAAIRAEVAEHDRLATADVEEGSFTPWPFSPWPPERTV